MKTKLSNKDILDILRADKVFLSDKFGVINIGLFGSYAKGKQSVDSDIDILVELKEPRFEWLAGLQIYLEQKLGRRIEIVRKGKHISHRFQKAIEKDICYVQ